MSMDSPVFEKDTIILYCSKAKGFVFSQLPCSCYSHITIFPVQSSAHLKDPAFPNLHFASFQVLPENFNKHLDSYSPFDVPVDQKKRSLVYGRKIKLLHVASKKYLSIRGENDSDERCNRPIAYLNENTDDTCLFRILPIQTRKLRSEDVQSEDVVKIECVVKEGHHILCTLNPLTNRHEFKKSVAHSEFVIYSHTSKHSEMTNKALRGGGIVMLFNVMQESYVAGRAKRQKANIEVGAKRHKYISFEKAPPSFGECFWQLEKTDYPLRDDQFDNNDNCRIKHLPTQKYLAVQKDQLFLKELRPGLCSDELQDVTFRLVSVREDTGSIVKGSYVQLRHKTRNLAVKEKVFLQYGAVDDAFEWYKVVLEDSEQSKQHYFGIEAVKHDLIDEYYHVSSVVSVLRECKEKFTAGENPPVMSELNAVLCKLVEWISVSSYHQKNSRVNMLIVAQGVDILVGFLHKNIQLDQEVCRNVCRVLECYLEGSNRMSHLYLAKKRFTNTLFSRIGHNIDVEKVLTALAKYESIVTKKNVKRIQPTSISLDTAGLEFLSTLCYSGGKPFKSLQNIILKIVIGKDILFKTTLAKEGDKDEVHFKSPERLAGPVSRICSKSTADENQKEFDFFVAQLKLFSSVCKGVNLEAIEKICGELKYVTLEEALLCIKDNDFDPSFRSACLDFVVSAFVDHIVEESGVDIDNIWHCYIWEEIKDDPKKTARFAVIAEDKPEIDQFKKLYDDLSMEHEEQKLLTQKLSVLEPLVSHWFFEKDDEIREIIKFLIKRLKGPCSHIKTKAVKILHLFFKQFWYLALSRFIFDFKYLKEEMILSSHEDYIPIKDDLASLIREDYKAKPSHNQEVCKRLRDYYFSETIYPFDLMNGEREDLVTILLDLLNYDDDQLRLSSTQLLFDMYQEENILFRDAQISYIVTETSMDVYRKMDTRGCFSDKSHILLRMIQGKATSGKIKKKLDKFLDYVSEVCILEDDETLCNACNQGIAFSSGVFTAIFTYVLNFCSTDAKGQIALLIKACNALRRIIRKNDQGQSKVFESFVDLLEVKSVPSTVAYLLTETLTDNVDICSKLSEANIKKMFQLTNDKQKKKKKKFVEIYVTLEAAMKVSKSFPNLLKTHQDLVSQIFFGNISKDLSEILTHGNECLTTLKECEDDDIKLNQLLCVCDMLATCAEGQNTFGADLCQSIFTLEDLINILGNPDVSIERKKPFARLLNWAYINTEKDSLSSIDTLVKNGLFWVHLEQCAFWIDDFSAIIQQKIDTNRLRLLLNILMSQHISIQKWMEKSKDINEPIKPKGSIEEEQMTSTVRVPLLNGLLLYIVDGIIPLVTTFCKQLAAHSSGLISKEYPTLLTPRGVAVLKSIGDSIANLLISNPDIFVTSREHFFLFDVCLNSIRSLLPPTEQHQTLKDEIIFFRDAQFSSIAFTQPSIFVYSRMIAPTCFTDDSHILQHMIEGKATSGDINNKLIRFLDYVADICILEGDETLCNASNQGIVFKSGVFTAIFTYVRNFCSTDAKDQMQLLCKACHTLRRIIRKNDQGQFGVFESFVDLLKVKSVPSTVAYLLTETLTDNVDICSRLSEDDIRKMFQLANNDHQEYYEFYVTLEAAMKVSKSFPNLLKKHQALVSKIFFDDITKDLTDGNQCLITLKECKYGDIKLDQLLCVCDMLATCAEGHNVFGGIFTLEDLINILGNPDVSIERKKPFARLLNWAYLNTENDSLSSIHTVVKNDLFWVHLEQCVIFIDDFSGIIQRKQIDANKLRLLLNILMSQHISIQKWMEKSKDINEPIKPKGSIEEEQMPSAQTVPLNSLLIYIVDGIIPLITTFCKQFADHNSSGLISEEYPILLTQRHDVLKSVGDSIGNILIKNPDIFVTSEAHFRLFDDCLNSIRSLLPPTEQHQTLKRAIEITSDHHLKLPVVLKYKGLEEEWELNKKFKLFTENFQITYEGRIQADSGIKEFEDLLPCGTRFTKLVELFAGDRLQELKNAENLFNLLDILYRKLQQPLTGTERVQLDSMLLTTLQVLSRVVIATRENIKSKTPDEFKNEYDKLIEALLVHLKSHEVMPHLSHPKDEIAVQVLVFLGVLLDHSNEKAQHEIGLLIQHQDTKFFVRISKILHKSVSRFKQIEKDSSTDEIEEPDLGIPTVRPYTIEEAGQEEITIDDAIKRTGIVLDVVSRLCDNQNSKMQEILQEQEFYFSNVNIVAEISVLLQTLSEHLNSKNMKITQKTIQALIEMCAGNYTNQELAFKGQIVESINTILQHLFVAPPAPETPQAHGTQLPHLTAQESCMPQYLKIDLGASAIELLEIMLEETHEKSQRLAQGISDDLDVRAILSAMLKLDEMSEHKGLSSEDLKIARRGIYRAYHVLKKIADYLNITVDEYVKDTRKDHFEAGDLKQNMETLWKHVGDWSLSIEVNYLIEEEKEKKGILTRVYFPYNPKKQLENDEKEDLKDNIDRQSQETKLKDLLKWIKYFHKKKSYISSMPGLEWSISSSARRHWVLCLLTLLLNVFVIAVFEVPESDVFVENASGDINDSSPSISFINAPVPQQYLKLILIILIIMGIVHFVLGMWMLIEYIVKEYPNILFHIFQPLGSLKKWVYRLERFFQKQEKTYFFVKLEKILEIFPIRPQSTDYSELVLSSFGLPCRIIFVLCSFSALFSSGYFYCGCILYVFLKIKEFHPILIAVKKSFLSLITVGLLVLAVLLIYAVLSFAFFHNFFDPGQSLYCNTLFQCFISVIRELLGTNIPVRIVGQEDASFTIYLIRTIFDLMFFIVITTFALNIVTAILLNKFSDLREKREDIEKDMSNCCFICGSKSDKFERQPQGFRGHVQNHHSKWNYIYFAFYLDSLKTNDRNALEKYVFECIEEEDIGFFPLCKED